VGEAWRLFHVSRDSSSIDHVIVQFVTEEHFAAHPEEHVRTAAAYMTYSGANIGSGIPKAVIRHTPAVIASIQRNGSAVIHEMLHVLLLKETSLSVDFDHAAEGVWSGEDSITSHAQSLLEKTTRGTVPDE
jgi:hypothetical protein